MNLLKLTPEIRSYIKNLDERELFNQLNEKRLRQVASMQNKQTQPEDLLISNENLKFKNQVICCDISDWYNKSLKIEN
jgi:hypothetical protein